jgi:hypothetical protein
MEFTTINTPHEELAEALRGCHGKKVEKDCSFVYLGQAVIGIGKSTYILDKACGVPHHEWHQIGNDVFFAILR